MRDTTGLKQRFQRWKAGEQVYDKGRPIPHYEGGEDDYDPYNAGVQDNTKVVKTVPTKQKLGWTQEEARQHALQRVFETRDVPQLNPTPNISQIERDMARQKAESDAEYQKKQELQQKGFGIIGKALDIASLWPVAKGAVLGGKALLKGVVGISKKKAKFNEFGIEALKSSSVNHTRTKFGDVEVDNPELLYHVDRGDFVGAFDNHQGAYIEDGMLFPGPSESVSIPSYSWWNLGKPYRSKPMPRLMVTTVDEAPSMLHVRSQNYPIGQWNGKTGFVRNSEYVSSKPVDVNSSTYTFIPGYGYRKNIRIPNTYRIYGTPEDGEKIIPSFSDNSITSDALFTRKLAPAKIFRTFQKLKSGDSYALIGEKSLSSDSYPLMITQFRRHSSEGNIVPVRTYSGEYGFQKLNRFGNGDISNSKRALQNLNQELGTDFPMPIYENGQWYVPSIFFTKR